MHTDMEWWTKVRLEVTREGKKKREVLRDEGIGWGTLKKILTHPGPPGYRLQKPRPKLKIGAYLERIAQILEEDKALPKKQRHTAKRIYERIREMGYGGKYTQVKEAVRLLLRVKQEVFMPLIHRVGEAQVDFGYALAKVSGVLRKVGFFVMVLPYSNAFFVMAFERECTESYWEGHIRAFENFGGVPTRISYDNSKVLVSKIIGPQERKLTDGFLKLQSHYLFQEHFCRVGRPNEKGVVEGVVKYTRQNFFVPVPQVRDLEELNAQLAKRCKEDLKRCLRGKAGTKEERLKEDQAAFFPLPAGTFDACRKQPTGANSLSLVRFDDNDYSVPVAYAHHDILAKGYVDRVVLCHQDKVVAEHRRSWGKEGTFFDPLHYLPLLERKPGSLDYARPLAGLDLPECFDTLRRRLQGQEEKEGEGTREFIRVLRLLEDYPMARLRMAVEKALRVQAHSREAILQFLTPRFSWRNTTFLLGGRKHLRLVKIAKPDLSAYGTLLSKGGVR
ncbi:MAG TPA: IS21 family transposase [Thermodesulfobacteriota bacterium]|nr:IS21 family transposase [Thermodesulfobacteriota bacterium]